MHFSITNTSKCQYNVNSTIGSSDASIRNLHINQDIFETAYFVTLISVYRAINYFGEEV